MTSSDRCGARLVLFLLLGVITAQSWAVAAAEAPVTATDRERITCPDEAKSFGSWSWWAGTDSESELLERVSHSKIVAVTVGDGRTIRGMQLTNGNASKSALLIIPGNVWSTVSFSRGIAELFPVQKLDVFFFDFRGYGLSKPGNPTMSAILADYRDIASWLERQGYSKLYLYAFSFGGVVAIDAFHDLKPFTRVVVDSAPARPSELFGKCQPSYDPVDNFPRSCARLVFMHGTSDRVVPRKSTQPLIEAVLACGGKVDVGQPRGHPFQSEWRKKRAKRVAALIQHLDLDEGP